MNGVAAGSADAGLQEVGRLARSTTTRPQRPSLLRSKVLLAVSWQTFSNFSLCRFDCLEHFRGLRERRGRVRAVSGFGPGFHERAREPSAVCQARGIDLRAPVPAAQRGGRARPANAHQPDQNRAGSKPSFSAIGDRRVALGVWRPDTLDGERQTPNAYRPSPNAP